MAQIGGSPTTQADTGNNGASSSPTAAATARLPENVQKPPTSSGVTSWRMNVGPAESLAELDKRGSGQIDVHDVRLGIHQMRMMKKAVILLLILTVGLLVGMCCTTYLAVQWAKEVHVKNTALVDSDGHGISTLQQVGSIGGVSIDDSARRLAGAEENGIGGNDSLYSISHDDFMQTSDGYASGQADWVVALPDATQRTVQIYGMESSVAWGISSSWFGSVLWQSTCPEGSTLDEMCDIVWQGGPDFDYDAYHGVTSDNDTTTVHPNSTTTTTAFADRLLSSEDELLEKLLVSRASGGHSPVRPLGRSLSSKQRRR